MIADVVNKSTWSGCPFVGSLPQASAKLLEPENLFEPSVGRSIITVSSVGRSTPPLNMSTAKTISTCRARVELVRAARGADVVPAWTATVRHATATEEISHEVRVPLRNTEAKSAFAGALSKPF